MAELARAQAEFHRQSVEIAAAVAERLQARGDRQGQLAVAELMGDAYRVMAERWEQIGRAALEPPNSAEAARGR